MSEKTEEDVVGVPSPPEDGGDSKDAAETKGDDAAAVAAAPGGDRKADEEEGAGGDSGDISGAAADDAADGKGAEDDGGDGGKAEDGGAGGDEGEGSGKEEDAAVVLGGDGGYDTLEGGEDDTAAASGGKLDDDDGGKRSVSVGTGADDAADAAAVEDVTFDLAATGESVAAAASGKEAEPAGADGDAGGEPSSEGKLEGEEGKADVGVSDSDAGTAAGAAPTVADASTGEDTAAGGKRSESEAAGGDSGASPRIAGGVDAGEEGKAGGSGSERAAEGKYVEEEEGEEEVELALTILPHGVVHNMLFDVHRSVEQLKLAVVSALHLSALSIVVSLRGTVLVDDLTLADCGIRGGQEGVALDFTVEGIEDGEASDSIHVVVDLGAELELVEFDVAILRELRRKPYLGGYRHRKTGVEYHHASSQTESKKERGPWVEKFHRETQTVQTITRSAQTTRESGTQMMRADLFVDDRRDVLLSPRPYFDSTSLMELKLVKAVVLQSHWRGYKARCRAMQIKAEQRERRLRLEEEDETKRAEAEARHKAEIERRMHPRTFEDFEILYNELENWRAHETDRIMSSGLDEAERRDALAHLLHKETKLLQMIDRLKNNAAKENHGRRTKRMLHLMALPKKWAMSDGEVAEVHTPFTTRAKELLELFNGLQLPLLTIDERLDVLLHVKWTVKEFDCNLTRNIVDLIDREADLLNRGRSEKSLEGLRKRINNLFLQFIETPEFNPEASRFQKVPRDFLVRPDVMPIGPEP
eukprot:PLAT7002.1.p1 GENE.PLAT7002.1~~PLAT7002.1.p1  ORF type:complete len:768 (+),score=410.07 PLAT7002.1:32-2305(+)